MEGTRSSAPESKTRTTDSAGANQSREPAGTHLPGVVSHLHRTFGNRAVSRILADIGQHEANASTATAESVAPVASSADSTMREVAPEVGAAVFPAGNGRPLEAPLQRRYEKRLGADLADVRIHTDAQSAASAASLHAAAYTLGPDIVFGAGNFRPQAPAGEWLLMHELAHVVQQKQASVSRDPFAVSNPGDTHEIAASRAANAIFAGHPASLLPGSAPIGIYRQHDHAPQVGEVGPGAESLARIRQWLEDHEFAPPQQQPEGERHVLLNGQDVPISEAVRSAVAELHLPEADVRSVIQGQLGRSWPYSARGATFVGPGNLVPGLPLVPRTHEDDVALGRANELMTVDDWLEEHHFYQPVIPDPRGRHVMLDGHETTIEDVADHVMAILGGAGRPRLSYLTREEVLVHLRRRYVAAPSGPATQMVLGYTLVPSSLQALTGAPDPLNPIRTQHQFSFTITRTHHTSDSGGLESSFQGSVTFDELGNIVNLQAGGQEAVVTTLLNGWIQVSGFVQAMVSANWSMTAAGSAHVSPGLQVAAGAQILLTPQLGRHLRLFDGHLAVGPPQIGVQALAGGILTDQGVQGGGSVGIVLNIPFDFPH